MYEAHDRKDAPEERTEWDMFNCCGRVCTDGKKKNLIRTFTEQHVETTKTVNK